MRKVSIILAHWQTWKWTAICLYNFQKYGLPIESEIIVCDNSPDHPSLKALMQTQLGDGVKVVEGERDFNSHGRGYELCLKEATGDHIFCAETDSFPVRVGWFDEFVKASADYDFIGPSVPQSSGRYRHPAGCLINRKVIDSARLWIDDYKDWLFVPSAGVKFGSDKPYHVIAHKDFIGSLAFDESLQKEIELWKRVDVFQQMGGFDEDDFSTYSQRTGITNWKPTPGKQCYMRIAWEAGQWLSYFAQSHGFRCLDAQSEIHWMPGHEGGQAAYSTVFGGFTHRWCGTSSFCNGIAPDVREFKMRQMNEDFAKLPQKLRHEIELLEAKYA